MISVYRFLTVFLYPIFIVIIYLRRLLKKEDSKRYKEKLFSSHFFLRSNNQKKLVWIHAASIGETQSMFPIIKKLNEQNKNLEFLITTVTLSARNLIKNELSKFPNIIHKFFPNEENKEAKIFIIKKMSKFVTKNYSDSFIDICHNYAKNNKIVDSYNSVLKYLNNS